MKPEYIVIHHSLTEDGKTVSWGSIRDYHTKVQKWQDIGYHYGIEMVGNTYEVLKGRMDTEDGAHCLGFNGNALGICVVGNFDHAAPSPMQLALLVKLVKSLMVIHGVSKERVIGHWESFQLRNRHIEKTCPGNAFSMFSFRKLL